MSTHRSDRNLLIGILAFQMEFISRDELIAALTVWVQDKTQALDEIFVSLEMIDFEIRDLIIALVKQHLLKHDDDPQSCLASFKTMEPTIRRHITDLHDSDLDESISFVGLQITPSETTDFVVGPTATAGRRFRIIRHHAKGGLGVVSLAKDEDLNREVAVKEIHQKLSNDPTARERFLLEAEITGGLEHPGIVPVYGLGHYEDGRPFYAMRFIKGESLKEAIEQFNEVPDAMRRATELRKLLGRFVFVCNAIAYAHSRGILHRDLKPGNIMLGNYGETLVVGQCVHPVQ